LVKGHVMKGVVPLALPCRPDTKYRLMAYHGRLKAAAPEDLDSYGLALNRNMGALLGKIARGQGTVESLRHMDCLESDEEEVEGRTEQVDLTEEGDGLQGTNTPSAAHGVPHLAMTLHEEREKVLR